MGGEGAPGSLAGAALRPPELEAEYRARFLRADGRTAAVVAGGLFLLSIAYVANDARLVGPSTFRILLALRMATAAVTVALVWAGIRGRRPAVLDGWCLAWVASSALVTAIVQSTRPADYLLPVMGDLLLVVAAWTLVPNRFSLQAIGASVATVATVTWLVAFRDRPAPAASLLVANALLATNLAAGFVSWRLQRTRRLQFLAEREQAEIAARLRASEEQRRELVENLQAGVVVHEADTSVRLNNAKASELLGLTPDQMRGRAAIDPAWRFVREDGTTMPVGEYPVNRVLAAGRPVLDQVAGIDRPGTGDRAWVITSGYPVHRAPGRIDHVVVTFVDITGRKQAEDALQRSESLRRTVTENFPNGVVGLFDRDLRCVLIDGTNTVTSTDPRAWQGKTLEETIPPEVLPLVEAAFRATLAGESRRLQMPIGGHWIDVLLRPVRNAAGEVVQGLFMTQDVTEKRALEEQLVVASRLAALGTLVAGVAHEINNPLTGELAGQGAAIEEIEAVREALGSGETLDRDAAIVHLVEALDALRDAQAGGRRIAQIVKDLSLFGRPDPRRVPVRIIDVVEEAMRWLPASLSGSTTIRVENLGAPEVLASPGQIGQVLVNLVTNAAKSVAGGRRGVVTIVVGSGGPGAARLEVTDDGAGIEPGVLKRIFDPFFTTREVGEGAGLGLPICHSIVTAHGGTITASSVPGEGSTFRVELPALAQEA